MNKMWREHALVLALGIVFVFGCSPATKEAATPKLFEAITAHDAATVKSLIGKFPDLVNVKDKVGNLTPLHRAAQSGDLAIAQILVGNGADVNSRGGSGGDMTPILCCVLSKTNPELVNLLLDHGVDPNSVDSLGVTVLMKASQMGKQDVVELLTTKGVEVNKQDRTVLGYAALHYAVAANNAAIVDLLIQKGANVNAVDKDNQTPLKIALSASEPSEEARTADKSLGDAVKQAVANAVVKRGIDRSAVIATLRKSGGKE